jgi:hypothetical protein
MWGESPREGSAAPHGPSRSRTGLTGLPLEKLRGLWAAAFGSQAADAVRQKRLSAADMRRKLSRALLGSSGPPPAAALGAVSAAAAAEETAPAAPAPKAVSVEDAAPALGAPVAGAALGGAAMVEGAE